MATVETKYEYLERDPNSSYKQLFVKGRRLRALALYRAYASTEEPQTIEEVADNFSVPVEAVREAIAYCEADPIEIRRDFALEEALLDARGMNDPNYKWKPTPRRLTAQESTLIQREIDQRFYSD